MQKYGLRILTFVLLFYFGYTIFSPSTEDKIIKQLKHIEVAFSKTKDEPPLQLAVNAKKFGDLLTKDVDVQIELQFRNIRKLKSRAKIVDLTRYIRTQVSYINIKFLNPKVTIKANENRVQVTGLMRLQFSKDVNHSQEISFTARFKEIDGEWLLSFFQSHDPIEQ